MRMAQWVIPLIVIGLTLFSAGLASAQENNTPPVAEDDAHSVNEDTELVIAAPGILANDTGADGDGLSAVLVEGPSNGTLTLNGDGSFTYTPAPDYNGEDSFTYKANDGAADSNEATVTITVNAVNDAPVANDDSATTDQNTAVTIDVLDNDTDVDGDALTVTIETEPGNGEAVVNGDGTVTYTPDEDFTGEDSFTYIVSDGELESETATVTVAVNPQVAEEESEEGEEEGKRKGFVGTVEAIDDNLLTLVRKGAGERKVTVVLPDDWEDIVKTPGGPRVRGEFSVGARVAVLAQWVQPEDAQGGYWEAIQVLVKPVKPPHPINGVLVEVDAEEGSITIVTPSGKTHTLQLPEGVEAPAVGEVVTLFPEVSIEDEGDEEGGPPQVRGLVRASQVRERLQRHLEEVSAEDGEQAPLVERLASLLENHAGRHVGILKKLSESEERLPGPAKMRVLAALHRAQQAREEAWQKAQEARARVEKARGRGGAAGGGGDEGDNEGGSSGENGPPTNRPGRPDSGDQSQDGSRGRGDGVSPGGQSGKGPSQ